MATLSTTTPSCCCKLPQAWGLLVTSSLWATGSCWLLMTVGEGAHAFHMVALEPQALVLWSGESRSKAANWAVYIHFRAKQPWLKDGKGRRERGKGREGGGQGEEDGQDGDRPYIIISEHAKAVSLKE